MTDPTPAPPSDSNPAATKSEDDAAKPPSKGRYRGRGRRNNANAQTKTATAKGANDTLNELGCIFDCIGAKQAEQFETSLKVLATWVGASWDGGSDVSRCLLSPRFVKPDIPVPPFPENLGRGAEHEWKEDFKIARQRIRQLNDNLKKLYSTVWGQCTDPLKSRVKTEPEHHRRH